MDALLLYDIEMCLLFVRLNLTVKIIHIFLLHGVDIVIHHFESEVYATY